MRQRKETDFNKGQKTGSVTKVKEISRIKLDNNNSPRLKKIEDLEKNIPVFTGEFLIVEDFSEIKNLFTIGIQTCVAVFFLVSDKTTGDHKTKCALAHFDVPNQKALDNAIKKIQAKLNLKADENLTAYLIGGDPDISSSLIKAVQVTLEKNNIFDNVEYLTRRKWMNVDLNIQYLSSSNTYQLAINTELEMLATRQKDSVLKSLSKYLQDLAADCNLPGYRERYNRYWERAGYIFIPSTACVGGCLVGGGTGATLMALSTNLGFWGSALGCAAGAIGGVLSAEKIVTPNTFHCVTLPSSPPAVLQMHQ